MNFKIDLSGISSKVVNQVNAELPARAAAASQELRNASLEVLRGQRSGKRYIVPGTGRVKYNKKNHTGTISYKRYTASAPGEPPAVRTGTLRRNWRAIQHGTNHQNPAIETNVPYAGYLEQGTSKMAPRPFEQKIIEKAKPKVEAIYAQPYDINP